MSDSSRFIRAMKQISAPEESQKVDIVTGTVTSVGPLIIKTDETELSETFLVVGALCQNTTIKVPNRVGNMHIHLVPEHTTQPATVGDHGTHTHQITAFNTEAALPDILLWRGLQVGDQVLMIRMADSQQYYVLQRKEGIT